MFIALSGVSVDKVILLYLVGTWSKWEQIYMGAYLENWSFHSNLAPELLVTNYIATCVLLSTVGIKEFVHRKKWFCVCKDTKPVEFDCIKIFNFIHWNHGYHFLARIRFCISINESDFPSPMILHRVHFACENECRKFSAPITTFHQKVSLREPY